MARNKSNMTVEEWDARMARQRSYRKRNGNKSTRIYEKTKRGFLMRLYRNMKSRISGIQKAKFHLYEGKELLSKEEFYAWAYFDKQFHKLFEEYEKSGYEQRLAPSVDRINPDIGYTLDNMEFITHSENSRRGALSESR